MGDLQVLYLIDNLYGGGAETSLEDLLPALRIRGAYVRLATLRSDDGLLETRLRGAGFHIDHLHDRSIRSLYGLLRMRRVDLLHTTLLRSDFLGRVVGRALGLPVVTTLPNLSYGPEHRSHSQYGALAVRGVHVLDATTAPLVTRFHAISDTVAEVMGRRLHVGVDRIDVVYRSRDSIKLGRNTQARRQRVRSALGLPPHAPVILCVGRLDQQKALEVAIAAFNRLRTRVPGVRMLIAGRPGNATDVVLRAAQRSPDVAILGHRTDVPDLLVAADVLCFPSRWEGLGGTVVEALFLETPVVATAIPALAEVLRGTTWPLVPVDNNCALAEALELVLSAAPERNRAAARGAREKALASYDVDTVGDGMRAFYDRAVRG